MRGPWKRLAVGRHERRHRRIRPYGAYGDVFGLCDEELAIIVDQRRNA